MDWTVLGIEPTADKKAITKAYRTQLMHTNPEDKPEEFKVLREAYEQALSWVSRQEDAAKNAKSAQAAAEGDPEALVAEAAKTMVIPAHSAVCEFSEAYRSRFVAQFAHAGCCGCAG